jgi:hypothetical protein
MRLYRVTNGFQGNSDVHVLVIADTDTEAVGLAVAAFEKSRQDFNRTFDYDGTHGYPPAYSDKDQLRFAVLCADTAVAWASDVWD